MIEVYEEKMTWQGKVVCGSRRVVEKGSPRLMGPKLLDL
jgi:hypothetical protein